METTTIKPSNMKKTIEEAEARNSREGLLLGNYHYHVDAVPYSDGERSYIYLTRYNEECSGCPMWYECCGDDPTDDCQANNMKEVEPYSNTYDLVYYKTLNVLEDLDCIATELTDIDKLAILLAANCCNSDEIAYFSIFNNNKKENI